MHDGAKLDGLVIRNPLVGDTIPADLPGLLGLS